MYNYLLKKRINQTLEEYVSGNMRFTFIKHAVVDKEIEPGKEEKYDKLGPGYNEVNNLMGIEGAMGMNGIGPDGMGINGRGAEKDSTPIV